MNAIPRIYINPGHSDKDPGAVGYEVERRLNVKVSEYQREYLLAHYICEVRMNPGTLGNLYDICDDANKWGANLFDSKHFNAGGGDGYEALVYSVANKPLGQIYEKYVKAIGQNSRGVKINPGYVVLRNTHMPAIINECAFVDNKKDIQDWNDDAELKQMGIAHAKAAAEFLKLKEKNVTPSAPAPTPTPVVKPTVLYRVQCGAYSFIAKALVQQKKLKAAGFDTYIVKADDGLYKIQIGAYDNYENAEKQVAKLKAAGYSCFITTKSGTAVNGSAVSDEAVTAEVACGDKVRMQIGALVWGKTYGFSSWVYNTDLYVREINGDCVTVSTNKTGDVTGNVHKKYLTKI